VITTKHFARALALVLFAFAVDSQAASPRVYLASNGANTGACTRTAPCLTLAYALTQVSPKGEIAVLDTSNHGPFTVTKSVTIVAAPGAYVAGSVARVSNTMVVSNFYGLHQGSNDGTVISRGNNTVLGNTYFNQSYGIITYETGAQ